MSEDVKRAYSPVGVLGLTGFVLHTLCYHSETRVCSSNQPSYTPSFPNVTMSVFASLDKLSNLIASNQSLLKSEQDTEVLKKMLHETKETAAEAKKQAEAVQKGTEQLLRKMRENREEERAQQAKVDQQARSQLLQVRQLVLTWCLDVAGNGRREGGGPFGKPT